VLFVFVIMLLNAGAEAATFQVSRIVKYFGALLLAAFLGLVSFIIQGALPRSEGVIFGAFQGTTLDVGRKLFTTYLLPFEVTSVLILIAIVGAVVLARKEV
jgi:NADH-quinone oxidoreductase subunit J